MKAIKYIMAVLLPITMSSCGNDWLNLEPQTSEQTDKVINILSDCDFALNGVYSTMQNAYAYSGRLVYYGDALGDDMQAYSATKRTGSYYLMEFTKDNAPTSFWSYPNNLIASCNMILEKIDNIPTNDNELRDFYKGQALALRALFLFDLTKFYGYPYKKDNGASLGVPVTRKMLQKEDKPERNTVAECYKAIIEDLTEAVGLMDNDYGRKFTKGHINRWAAMSLLSRVYLYHGDDALALNMAEEAIKGAEDTGYRLWTNKEYPTAWGADASRLNPGEVLFEIVNTTDDSPGKESLGRLHDPSGYKDICLTSSFYVLLNEDPYDVRLKLLVFSSKRAFVNKYQPQDGEIAQDANIPLIRLSETYLNAAEAAFKTNDKKAAAKYLNAIVSRANPDKSVDENDITLDRIMTERRKELVGEGHRMFDALRDGGSVDRKNASKTPKEISSTKHLTELVSDRMNYDWNFFRCVLPIPKAEIDANKNIKQNPSY